MLADTALLARVTEGLRAAFGARLERLVLFGSRARGDARPDSDYDLALFIRNFRSVRDEIKLILPVTEPLLVDEDIEVNVFPFPAEAYNRRTLLMHEIRKDGIPL